jgi:hypothetical protein
MVNLQFRGLILDEGVPVGIVRKTMSVSTGRLIKFRTNKEQALKIERDRLALARETVEQERLDRAIQAERENKKEELQLEKAKLELERLRLQQQQSPTPVVGGVSVAH